jgi:hypothetical protein
MKPIDFRNATFADLEARLPGLRWAVLEAWRKHGPATTAEIAERSGINVLNVRPRTNELHHQLGYLCLHEQQPVPGEATYRVRTHAEHMAWLTLQAREAANPQRQLAL